MNVVISTETENIKGLKQQLSEVPRMEGLERQKFPQKSLTILAMKMQLIKLHSILNQEKYFEKLCSAMHTSKCPYNATFEELSAWNPDGYLLSNGPGDPELLQRHKH